MVVVSKRRKTCFVGSSPYPAIPEDAETGPAEVE